MAEPMQYTGVTYDADIYMKPSESLSEYMTRLAKLRATGVLGGGGMLDTPTTIVEDAPVVNPVSKEITAAPLAQVSYSSSSDSSQANGWDRMKTQEQKVAEALARQSELYAPNDPSTIIGLMPFSGAGLLGSAVEAVGDYMDTETAKDFLDSKGFTEQYGEEATQAMAENPLAMMHLMSSGDLPAVGGFDRLDLSKYEPATWGNTLGNVGKGLVNSIFGTDYELWSQPAMSDYNITPVSSSIRNTTGMFDTIDGQQVNTLEDVLNISTVGNRFAGYGNYNPDANNGAGGYTIGTAANRNPDGSYTIGTAANALPEGGYLIGTSSGDSPIAATTSIAKAAESTSTTGSGSGQVGDSYSPSWSSSNTSSWDTSGGGSNPDGSYDISSWF